MRFILVFLLLGCFSISAVAKAQTDDAAEGAIEAPKKKMTYEMLSPEDRAIYDRGAISNGHYITGGVLSSTVGFGIGQAVQGRYAERGWVFTLGEVGTLAMMIGGVGSCINSNDNCASGFTLFLGGYLGFIGFRVWDAVDAWVVPAIRNSRYRRLKRKMADHDVDVSMAAYPIFTPQAVGAGVGVEFRF